MLSSLEELIWPKKPTIERSENLQEYFRDTYNLTKSSKHHETKKEISTDHMNSENFRFIGTERLPVKIKPGYRKQEILHNVKRENNKYYYLSNIRICGTDIENFASLTFVVGPSECDKIYPNSVGISQIYTDIYKDDTSFQVPFAGTVGTNKIYLWDCYEYILRMEAVKNDESVDEQSFVISYDLYEGPKPKINDVYSVLIHQFTGTENISSALKKLKLHFCHPTVGLGIKIDEGDFLSKVNSVTFKIVPCKKSELMCERTITLNKELLVELNELYGDGIIPFAPEDSKMIDTIRHAINFGEYEITMEFEFEDTLKNYNVEVHALGLNAIHYVDLNCPPNSLCPSMVYSN